MVKTTKVGKPRNFWRGFLLTVVTLGLYGIYWNFKAFYELHKQYDLESEGRDMPIVLFILGLLVPFAGPVLFLVYQWKFVETVNYVRGKMGLGEGVSGVEFILWVTLGWLLLIVGPMIGYYKLQGSINGTWEEYERRMRTMGAPPGSPTAAPVPPA